MNRQLLPTPGAMRIQSGSRRCLQPVPGSLRCRGRRNQRGVARAYGGRGSGDGNVTRGHAARRMQGGKAICSCRGMGITRPDRPVTVFPWVAKPFHRCGKSGGQHQNCKSLVHWGGGTGLGRPSGPGGKCRGERPENLADPALSHLVGALGNEGSGLSME